jgi:chemotaxis signal transduction protein
VSDVFDRLHRSLARLRARMDAGGALAAPELEARTLRDRTERIARAPLRYERVAEAIPCIVFERWGRRYAVRLEALAGVGPLRAVAHVPGTPEAYLGVTDRRGRVVAVVDLPRLFGAEAAPGAAAPPAPRWLLLAAQPDVVAGVAADELWDIVDVNPSSLARAMPTFPALAQRHTIGVMEDRTVVLNLGALLADRALRVDER